MLWYNGYIMQQVGGSVEKPQKFDFSFFLLIVILFVLMYVNTNIVFVESEIDTKSDIKIESLLYERQEIEDESR